jgi:hypothetical protein
MDIGLKGLLMSIPLRDDYSVLGYENSISNPQHFIFIMSGVLLEIVYIDNSHEKFSINLFCNRSL